MYNFYDYYESDTYMITPTVLIFGRHHLNIEC